MERYQTALYALGYYCGTIVSCRYRIPDDLCDSALHKKVVEHLEVAVADTILQHPLLQVGLVNEKGRKPYFVKLGSVSLEQQIEWRVVEGAEKYEQIYGDALINQIDTKFDDVSKRPGWRLAVLRLDWENVLEVMLVWNHSHFDGTGAKIFHETLLQSLNKTDAASLPNLTNHTIETNVTTKNMPPNQSNLLKYRLSTGYTVRTLWQELVPPTRPVKARHALGVPHGIAPRDTGIASLSIGHETLQKVLSVCRTNKTTLTGLLHAIALISLVSHVPEKDLGEMKSETPLNMRRYLKEACQKYPAIEPAKLLLNCVNKMTHSFSRELVQKVHALTQGEMTPERHEALEDSMWSVSATVRDEIKGTLDKGLRDDLAGLMGFVADWRDYAKDVAKKQRECSWLVTNIGVIDGEPEDIGPGQGWSIKRSQFTLSADVVAPIYSINVAAVKGGELCIDITWQDVIADGKIGKRLASDIEKWFTHIATKV